MTFGAWWILAWCAFFVAWRLWDEFIWDPEDTRHPPHLWPPAGCAE